MSPLVPAAYDIAWTIVVTVGVVLLVMALVRWFRSTESGFRSLLHILVILFVPLVGPAAYLFATKALPPARTTTPEPNR